MESASLQTLWQTYDQGSSVLVSGQNLPSSGYIASRFAHMHAPGMSVCVTATEEQAQTLASDLLTYRSENKPNFSRAESQVLHIPAHDSHPYSDMLGLQPQLHQRLASLYCLARHSGSWRPTVVVSASSLLRRVIPQTQFLDHCAQIDVNTIIDRDELLKNLISAGYYRSSLVEEPGQFSVRGGIIDVFPSVYRFPLRVELFGDEVESIRYFDPETQRTLGHSTSLVFHPIRETIATAGNEMRKRLLEGADRARHPSKATRELIDRAQGGDVFIGINKLVPAFHHQLVPLTTYLAPEANSHWFIYQPDQVLQHAQNELADADQRYQQQIESHQICFSPDQYYLPLKELSEIIHSPRPTVYSCSLLLDNDPMLTSDRPIERVHIPVEDNLNLRSELERARNNKDENLIEPLVKACATWRTGDYRVTITCSSDARCQQIQSLLEHAGVESITEKSSSFSADGPLPGGPVALVRGALNAGFTIPGEKLAVLIDSDILATKKSSTRRQKRAAQRAHDALKGGVADFSQLAEGDYLVHSVHGVGLYKGLRKLPIQELFLDFLHVEYRGGNLYLPAVRIGEVQRYVGSDGRLPRVDKLGGHSFIKSKRAVSEKVQILAEELLQLYAQRAALPGHAFPPPDALYREFEASFEFEPTPDQQSAIDAISEDMSAPKPMDRLICGDVGYGKTEVALRAMLRAVFGNKQVAFLAPTTILVEQHYQSMCKRFARWPVRLARLSRFQTKEEQTATLHGLATGQIDAVVGTHRLLSKDVRFKELGLVVIDEEQRFGVGHKERFKKMRANVEVLTLTATPIPRTLHLAMTGLRDLSIIATPPTDRRATRTFVARMDDGLLREAIHKELNRQGQIFFVSPRVENPIGGSHRSLREWAAHLGRLVPAANIAVAHGKLPAEALEKLMVEFVAGKYDILVSTAIVEAGLDIPRANTMFIDRADRFGLSQLYQLRGRIGRSATRAYCYLLVPAPEKLTDDARKRLEILQRHTELGAGFAIASHDLEIRGAGDFLGTKQSGSIAAIGFDAYTQMLMETVAELQGTPIRSEQDPELHIDIPGFIPDDYVPETSQRLTLYKRFASTQGEEDVAEIIEEITDCYGPIPKEVGILGELMVIKYHARKLQVISLHLAPSRLALAFSEQNPLSPEQLATLVQQAGSSYKLTPDMRLLRQFTKSEQEQPVDAAKATLLDLLRCVTAVEPGV